VKWQQLVQYFKTDFDFSSNQSRSAILKPNQQVGARQGEPEID